MLRPDTAVDDPNNDPIAFDAGQATGGRAIPQLIRPDKGRRTIGGWLTPLRALDGRHARDAQQFGRFLRGCLNGDAIKDSIIGIDDGYWTAQDSGGCIQESRPLVGQVPLIGNTGGTAQIQFAFAGEAGGGGTQSGNRALVTGQRCIRQLDNIERGRRCIGIRLAINRACLSVLIGAAFGGASCLKGANAARARLCLVGWVLIRNRGWRGDSHPAEER